VALVGGWLALRPSAAAWSVATLSGAPTVGTRPLGARGALRVGDELVTDGTSRARVGVGTIGEVDVEPNTRLRLLATQANDQRLALDRGTISAQVDAPPRIFFVETPAGVADPVNGIRQIIAGTGGEGLDQANTLIIPNSEAQVSGAYGLLKLTLSDGSYSWQFVRAGGAGVGDSGSGTCH